MLFRSGMPATDVQVNNGKIDVLVYELPPVVVTKDNAKEVFANDPGRMELLKESPDFYIIPAAEGKSFRRPTQK